jgi:flagellar motor switch protein FliN
MAGDSEQISQDEIEKLLAATKGATSATPKPTTPAASASNEMLSQDDIEAMLGKKNPAAAPAKPAPVAAATSVGTTTGIQGGDIEMLFKQAEQALASINQAVPAPPDVAPYKLTEFSGAKASAENATLDLLRDVELDLKIELGRTRMYLEDVLRLNKGAVVPLDRLAGDPVDIYVNGRLIARGEVLIMNDNFCVRIAELVVGEQAAA